MTRIRHRPGVFIAVGVLMLLVSLAAHRWMHDGFPMIAVGLLLRASVGLIIVGLLTMAGLRPGILFGRSKSRQRMSVILTVLIIGAAVAFWRVMVPVAF